MKKYICKLIFVALAAIWTFSSCGSVDMGDTSVQTTGLQSLTVQIVGGSQVFTPATKGPYNDGDVIIFKIPSPLEEPTDVSKMKLAVSLENNCKAEPAIPGVIDLTAPYELKVRTSTGEIKTYMIKVELLPPIASFQKEWHKNSTQLGFKYINWLWSLDVSGDYLFVHDGVNFDPDPNIRVYNKNSGDIVKAIPSPRTVIGQVRTDDAGHIIAGRINGSGAGFMLYVYNDIDDANPQLLLDYANDAGCPVNLGYRFSVVGNIKQGKAYVYATVGNRYEANDNRNAYYYWEFNNGIPLTVVPNKVEFTPIAGAWDYADVQRRSIDDDSDIFLSYILYESTDAQSRLFGSRFYRFRDGLQEVIEMDKSNHEYKILGYKVFSVGDSDFLAMLTQVFYDTDPVKLKVFDITDINNIRDMNPDKDGYNDFMIFESENYTVYNIMMFGDVAVSVQGNDAYIYGLLISNNASQGGIIKYHMKYYPRN
ncbi:hypothetical protein [Prevotella sp. 10(H)]|uniref:DUF5018 domain-containing protein n=1 Tax=Prevotella sp. 10(H) TaxID=1158294 RepID=UPI0004A71620|nr:hypothetical protein [Prevotella sp. 10(H)]